MTEEEHVKIAQARVAREHAHRLLDETLSRGEEIETIVHWLARARAKNNFSERITYMLQHPGEEHRP